MPKQQQDISLHTYYVLLYIINRKNYDEEVLDINEWAR